MNDNNLLALAAKASGRRISNRTTDGGLMVCIDERRAPHKWNPLTNNEDALVLAVRIGLQVTAYPMYDEPKHSVIVRKPVWDHDAQEGDGVEVIEPYGTDALAATRRAIVQAAAKLGATL